MAGERVREVPKDGSAIYLGKAREFYHAMKRAEEDEEWNAACLNAIHCAISSLDAITVFYLGLRSTGQSHDEITRLVARTGLESAQEKIKQFSDVIRLKSLVEYDAAQPSQAEARRMILQAKRIFEWAQGHLKK